MKFILLVVSIRILRLLIVCIDQLLLLIVLLVKSSSSLFVLFLFAILVKLIFRVKLLDNRIVFTEPLEVLDCIATKPKD